MKKESFLKLNAYHRVNFVKSVRNLIKRSTKLIGEAAMKLLDIVECCCDDDISSKRIEVDLIFNNKSQGKIALRFRLATNYDVDFLNQLSKRQVVTQKNDHLVTEKGAIGVLNVGESLPSVNTAFLNLIENSSATQKKFRVKPRPDPCRLKDTTYMTQDDMASESLKPSVNWIETGTWKGSLGKVYLEIIQCKGLPNMDVGIGNKTDAFVCCVHEDSVVQTNVIDDALNPMWMPWTQRAFVFHMLHPISALYLGVFDYDFATNHDGIGRVVINLNQFNNMQEYNLHYHLYTTSNVAREKPSLGSIFIRLKVEIHNEFQYLLASWNPPPRFHVNMSKNTSHAVVRYTCYGEYEDDKFSKDVMLSYIYEIFEYKYSIEYQLNQTFQSIIFWRPQTRVCGKSIPLHSALVFLAGIHLVENFHLLLPFLFWSIAWIMISLQQLKSDHPSPWYNNQLFQYLKILLRIPNPQKPILRNQNLIKATAYDNAYTEKYEKHSNKLNQEWEEQLKLNSITKENIQTNSGAGMFAFYEAFLPIALRMQQLVSGYCVSMRKMKDVLWWEEPTTSFWITLSFFSIGFVFYVLPWCFLLHWVMRIGIWTFLGPWMRFVDIYSNKQNDSFHLKAQSARVKGEQNTKLKAIREYLFGCYSIKVPTNQVARYHDFPLPDSSAKAQDFQKKIIHTTGFVEGQLLTGSMIHRQLSDRTFDDDLKSLTKQRFQLSALKSISTNMTDPNNNDHNQEIISQTSSDGFTEREETSCRKLLTKDTNFDQRDNVEEIEEQGIEVVQMFKSSKVNMEADTGLSHLYHSPDSEFVDIAFCRQMK